MARKTVLIPIAAVIAVLAGTGFFLVLSGRAADILTGQEAGPGRQLVVPAYDFDITLDFDRHTVDVREKMIVTNRTDKTWDRLAFCVTPAVHPGVFTLNRFALTIQREAQVVQPSVHSSMLTVDLARPARPGEELVAELDYRLALRKLNLYVIHPVGNLGYGSLVTQCGDCFATLTPFDPERGFREWEYAPVGDPYVYPLASYDVRVSAEPGVIVAAAGLVEQKGADWRFSLPCARSFAFTASRQYAVSRAKAGDIDLSCFYVKGFERQAAVILETAEQSLDLFGKTYGPYMGHELVIAQDAYGSAMEYSNFITIAHTYMQDYTPARPQLLLYLVAHEISHQWWYNAVGSDQVLEPWLDEGLAKYSEYLYFRAYRPEFVEWWEKNIAGKRPPDRYVDDSIYELADDSREYARVIYGMAPAFLRELQEKIGDQAFMDFLKDYYRTGNGRFVTAADFFAALGRHTREDITPILRTYFRHPPQIAGGLTGP